MKEPAAVDAHDGNMVNGLGLQTLVEFLDAHELWEIAPRLTLKRLD